MKKNILFNIIRFSVFFFASVSSFATEAEEQLNGIFSKANNLYQAGKFDEALSTYQTIQNTHLESADLYYNMGNCYFKLNKLAFSILYYEKALQSNPQHVDADHNLRFAHTRLIDKISPLPEFTLVRWWKNFVQSFSSKQWAFVNIALVSLLCLLIALFVSTFSYAARISYFIGSIVISLAFLLSLYASIWLNSQSKTDFGILTEASTYIKSAPSNDATDLFILHEGIKFKIIQTNQDWTRIMIEDGKDGWLPANQFEKI
jgi:tetratricopeptide (TPR) repeat protein